MWEWTTCAQNILNFQQNWGFSAKTWTFPKILRRAQWISQNIALKSSKFPLFKLQTSLLINFGGFGPGFNVRLDCSIHFNILGGYFDFSNSQYSSSRSSPNRKARTSQQRKSTFDLCKKIQIHHLFLDRVAKCQIFYMEQIFQTEFYPKKSA